MLVVCAVFDFVIICMCILIRSVISVILWYSWGFYTVLSCCTTIVSGTFSVIWWHRGHNVEKVGVVELVLKGNENKEENRTYRNRGEN